MFSSWSEELCSLLDVFLLVFISDDNVCAARLQFMLVSLNRKKWIVSSKLQTIRKQKIDRKSTIINWKVVEAKTTRWTNLSEQLFINGEPQIQVCWVVLQNPHQGVEIFTVLKMTNQFTKSSRLVVIRRFKVLRYYLQWKKHSQQTPCPGEWSASAASSCRKDEWRKLWRKQTKKSGSN